MTMRIRKLLKSLAYAGIAFCLYLTFLLVGSLWAPRLCGLEQVWDLKTGLLHDRSYLSGIKIGERISSVGLEKYFQVEDGPASAADEVLIFSRSAIQPARGGNWMRILHHATGLHNKGAISDAAAAAKLRNLIKNGDAAALTEWSNQPVPDPP